MPSIRRPTPVVRPWPVVGVLLAAGCAGAESASNEWSFEVATLPNGGAHVINTPPANEGPPTVMLAEELRIGSIDEEGPTSFGQIKGLAVTRDGRIAVLDAQAQELRLFAPDGRHLATFGGQGQGPGEMEAGYGLMLAPDGTLWVPDHQNGRMSVYDPDAGFLRSHPITLLTHSFVWRGAMSEDGRILKPSISLASQDRPNILRVYDSEMALRDSLPMPPDPDVDREDPPNAFFFKLPRGGQGYMQVPFYPGRQQLLDPRGVIWSTPYGDPSYRISMWTPGGDTTLVLETRRTPIPVTAAERDSVIDGVRSRLEELGAAPGQDWSKIPEAKPAVTSMFVSDEGQLWVRRASAGSGVLYDIYERDGRHVGSATTDLPIWDYVAPIVRGDRFWAVITDDLGVGYVVGARLPPIESTESAR